MNIPQYVRDYLLSVAAVELGLPCTANIEFEAGSSAGDGNLGSLVAVTITAVGHDAAHLLCKLMTENAEAREAMNLKCLFKREVLFYEKVMPALEQFRRSKDVVDGFFAYPKCYGCLCDEDKNEYLIVMEDLRHQQFEMWPKKTPVACAHVREVIREMAKFHALSFAMKDQQPAIFNALKDIDDVLRGLLKQSAFVGYLKESHCQMLIVLEKYLPQHADKFRRIWHETLPFVDRILDGKVWEPFTAFSHGDLWNNNTLFRYEQTSDSRTVAAVSFVDWQFLNYNSPALDLMFYIFSATDKDLRNSHYHELIQFYHSTLTDSVNALGSDADRLCPYHMLTEHLKVFGPMTYLTFPSSLDVIFEDDLKTFNAKTVDDDAPPTGYQQRVLEFAIDLIEFGYI